MLSDYKDKFDATIGKKFTVDSPGTTEYFIAGDGKDVVHFGEVDDKHEMVTGQPNVTAFKIREDWLSELAKQGIDPDAEVFEESAEESTGTGI